jgi:DNA-binding NarL/FixJ family response regulator
VELNLGTGRDVTGAIREPSEVMSAAAVRAIRVLVADRRPLIAEAIAALIGTLPAFAVTGVFCGEHPARSAAAARNPDIGLIGVARGSLRSLDLVGTVREAAPGARIVIVADEMEPDLVKFVLDERINGLLLSDGPAADFAACLSQVMQGHAVLPAGWQSALPGRSDGPLGSLSGRQMQVLTLLSEGCSYEEIGSLLFISLNTVKFHVRSIFLQLGVRNRVAAARVLADGNHPKGWKPTAREAVAGNGTEP